MNLLQTNFKSIIHITKEKFNYSNRLLKLYNINLLKRLNKVNLRLKQFQDEQIRKGFNTSTLLNFTILVKPKIKKFNLLNFYW